MKISHDVSKAIEEAITACFEEGTPFEHSIYKDGSRVGVAKSVGTNRIVLSVKDDEQGNRLGLGILTKLEYKVNPSKVQDKVQALIKKIEAL